MRKLTKPQKTQLKTGFRPVASLNTSGRRQPIPHDSRGSSNVGYEWKKRVAGLGSTSRKAKKMY